MNNTLTQEQCCHLYEIEPNYLLTNEHPNLYTIPTIHNVDLYKDENVPLVIINFLHQITFIFPKGEVMGFMHCQSLDVSEIVTETSTEPSSVLLDEDNDTGESGNRTQNRGPIRTK